MNQIDLKGRHAIVTGAAQGIGLAIATRLLESGASVSLWDRDREVLEQTRKTLSERGRVLAQVVDVCDAGATADLASWKCRTTPRLTSW